MQQRKLPEKQARVLYITLAAMLAVIVIISAITAINKRSTKDRLPIDTSYAEQTHPICETRPPVQTQRPVQTAPIQNETQPPAPAVTDKPVNAAPDVNTPVEDEPVSTPRVYVMPTEGSVIKSFSVDLPVYSATMNDYRAHTGIDIYAEEGTPVYCFTDGVVQQVYNDPMMGATIAVDHGDGLVSYYQNLNEQAADGIQEGAEVSAGDALGCVGATTLVELSDESHLHFELRCNGKPVDPGEYLSTLQSSSDALE